MNAIEFWQGASRARYRFSTGLQRGVAMRNPRLFSKYRVARRRSAYRVFFQKASLSRHQRRASLIRVRLGTRAMTPRADELEDEAGEWILVRQRTGDVFKREEKPRFAQPRLVSQLSFAKVATRA